MFKWVDYPRLKNNIIRSPKTPIAEAKRWFSCIGTPKVTFRTFILRFVGSMSSDIWTTAHQSQPTPQQSNRAASSALQSSVPRIAASPTQLPAPTPKQNYATLIDYTRYHPETIPYTLEHDGREQRYYISEKVLEFFDNEFDYLEVANWQELTNFAVALFVGMAGGPATAPSGCGCSSSTDNNWGRDKDEDDVRWVCRCTKATTQKLGKQAKYGLRR